MGGRKQAAAGQNEAMDAPAVAESCTAAAVVAAVVAVGSDWTHRESEVKTDRFSSTEGSSFTTYCIIRSGGSIAITIAITGARGPWHIPAHISGCYCCASPDPSAVFITFYSFLMLF